MKKTYKAIVSLLLALLMVLACAPLSVGADGKEDVELSEETLELYKNSYEILYNRITERGYAITSLTGTYFGMFTRDSSIQAMAHLAYGDSDAARAILKYLLSYHGALGLERATHIINELQDEEYRNNYLTGKQEDLTDYYEEQTAPGVAQFMINAPNNASATPFTTKYRTLDAVQAYLEGAKGATVTAEIYTELDNPATIVATGHYTFEDSTAGFKTISLDETANLTPGTTYYLKLYAPAGSAKVVWYGVTSGKTSYLKAWNYDMNAYGGNGWREVGVYTAFIIGGKVDDAKQEGLVSQRKSGTDIYLVNAPNNGAAQPFVPVHDTIVSVEAFLKKSSNNDTVKAWICTDYSDLQTAIGEATYTFGANPNGWQKIVFDTPVSVEAGKTYYLVLQATENSGKVIWCGTTDACGSHNSYNYDKNALNGWAEKPYYPAFEVVSYQENTVAQGFTATGNTASGISLDLVSYQKGQKVKVEIRRDLADAATAIASATLTTDGSGEKRYTVSFAEEASLQVGNYYYVVVTFEDTDSYLKLLTDPQSAADSYAFEENWEKIGYEFLVMVNSSVDKESIITLDGQTAATQEIPTGGETITAVKVLLSKDKGAAGSLTATLYKGDKKIDTQGVDFSKISEEADWVTIYFDLPFEKITQKGNYFIKLESENEKGNLYWCGSKKINNYKTYTEVGGKQTEIEGEAGFEALRSEVKLVSDYTQTDGNYMLIHAWVMYVNNNKGTTEDLEFIQESYPIISRFANYYLDDAYYFNSKLNLIFNPSLEHSRKIRYWQSYDLLTNVFASQALYELSFVAESMQDTQMASKWMTYAQRLEAGIKANFITELDGKQIYGEFYDVEDNMKFYKGMSWVNLAPIAAEWYAMDLQIMKNTYEAHKKYASVTMYGYKNLATEATLGTNELTKELIGKGIAWELMFCDMIGDTERISEILALELATAKKNNISVYPEFWKSESYVTDPGNQEHCSWQVYAVSRVFPQLTLKGEDEEVPPGNEKPDNDQKPTEKPLDEGKDQDNIRPKEESSVGMIVAVSVLAVAVIAGGLWFVLKRKKGS